MVLITRETSAAYAAISNLLTLLEVAENWKKKEIQSQIMEALCRTWILGVKIKWRKIRVMLIEETFSKKQQVSLLEILSLRDDDLQDRPTEGISEEILQCLSL